MSGPLSGICVIDLTSVGMGPYATQILGDMGADVIKVESPSGDAFRYVAPSSSEGMSAAYLQLNRNKKSIVLDLKLSNDLSVLHEMLVDADVLISSIRPGAMQRLGLTYARLQHEYPKLICCSVYGFSENGPYAGRPAFDDIIQAMSGIADLQGRGRDGAPAYVSSVIADKTTGLTAAYAVSMALYEREKSGLGQAIEVPMFETMVSFNLIEHMAGRSFPDSETGMGYERVLSKFRKPYQTLDGYISVLPYTTSQWRRFFELSGHANYATMESYMDPVQRGRNIHSMYRLLASIIAERTTQEWTNLLSSADIPMAPIASLDDLFVDPHLQSTDFFETHEHPTEGPVTVPGIPVTFSRTPGNIRTMAPNLDRDGAELRRQYRTGSKTNE